MTEGYINVRDTQLCTWLMDQAPTYIRWRTSGSPSTAKILIEDYTTTPTPAIRITLDRKHTGIQPPLPPFETICRYEKTRDGYRLYYTAHEYEDLLDQADA